MEYLSLSGIFAMVLMVVVLIAYKIDDIYFNYDKTNTDEYKEDI